MDSDSEEEQQVSDVEVMVEKRSSRQLKVCCPSVNYSVSLCTRIFDNSYLRLFIHAHSSN